VAGAWTAAMADQKEFNVIQFGRSDGADTGPGYWPATPAPPKKVPGAAADAARRTKPSMARLAEDDPRFVEWKVKLGILLKQELSPSPHEGNAWLVNFPRGYWLYEKSNKTWVSGYPIKSKLFRTPQEFAFHLIWLSSTSKDYKDCCCPYCNFQSAPKPVVVELDTPSLPHVESLAKPEKVQPKTTQAPIPITGQTQQQATVARPVAAKPSVPANQASAPVQVQPKVQHQQQLHMRPQTQSPMQRQSPAQIQPQHQAPTQSNPQPQAQPQPQPQPQAQAQAQANIVWSLRSPLVFRAGELVWFNNGASWRLGIIAASSQTAHELLPIGHGMVHRPNVVKPPEDMRPFYAFSVPFVTIPDLKDKVFDDIPWESTIHALGNDTGKRDVFALDASKMAATKIDYSYSTWSPVSQDQKTIFYYGCFLGAERIEIGDALRLRKLPASLMAGETAVMGLRNIFVSEEQGGLLFRGHLYVLCKDASKNIVPPEQLPIALRDELKWRQSTASKNNTYQYSLIKENVILNERSIKGRFYPTHRLMPILDPGSFNQIVASGHVNEQVIPQLNNRMEAGMGRYIGRKRNRIDTLGPCVAHGSRLALEGHVKEDV